MRLTPVAALELLGAPTWTRLVAPDLASERPRERPCRRQPVGGGQGTDCRPVRCRSRFQLRDLRPDCLMRSHAFRTLSDQAEGLQVDDHVVDELLLEESANQWD